MMISPLSTEGLFLLLLVAGSAIFAPLLIIAVVTRIKGKPLAWGGYLSLSIMFVATAVVGVFKRGVSWELLPAVLAFNGIALIVLTPAYLLVWWGTGKFMLARQHCRRSRVN